MSPGAARRARIHVALVPIYLWLAGGWAFYAWDLGTAGHLDRSGHIKGHDFAHFYILGTLAARGEAEGLYSYETQARLADRLVPEYEDRYVPIHGPQLSLLFLPFAQVPYEWALAAWLGLTALAYALCCRAVFRRAPRLRGEGGLAALVAAAYPAFYFLIAFGQTTAIALVCLTAAYVALAADRRAAAGLALGLLVYKPQLAIAAAVVFVAARDWRVVLGAIAGALLELGVAWGWYGTATMIDYWEAVRQIARVATLLEPIPHQMHSWRSFFELLLPWPALAMGLYLAASAATLVWTIRVWRSTAPLATRFAVLLIATVLVNPHVNVYDLVVIAPALVIAVDRAAGESDPVRARAILAAAYLCYVLLLFGRVALDARLQLSVPAMAALAWLLAPRRAASRVRPTNDQRPVTKDQRPKTKGQ